jgi:hypothetical protein
MRKARIAALMFTLKKMIKKTIKKLSRLQKGAIPRNIPSTKPEPI